MTILGPTNLPSSMPYHASQLYARNVSALVQHLAPEGELKLDFEDEITVRRLRHAEGRGAGMSAQLVTEITILVLAAFVGFEVISKVPTLLHTPLMSGTNAIHGIVIVGAIIVMGTPHPGLFMQILSFIAVVLATANVVGGFVVTDRMLEMFKKRPDEPS